MHGQHSDNSIIKTFDNDCVSVCVCARVHIKQFGKFLLIPGKYNVIMYFRYCPQQRSATIFLNEGVRLYVEGDR